MIIFILRSWKDTRSEDEKKEDEKQKKTFVPKGTEPILSEIHVAPLQKVYVPKSGPELFDVCSQLLGRFGLSWFDVLAIIGGLLTVALLLTNLFSKRQSLLHVL